MNITILSLRGPTKNGIRGGAREYIEQMSKFLVKTGHKVRIVCGVEPKSNLIKSENLDGVKIIRVGKCKWAVLAIWKYYIKYLKHDTDILIENIVSFPMFVPLIKGKAKFYAVVHHLTDKNYFKVQKIPIAIIGYIMEKFLLRVFYKNVKFVAVSEYTKKMLIKDGINSRKISVVNPGIRENYFTPGIKSEEPLIFFIGRYNGNGGNKRVDHLIEAFKRVSLKYPTAKLIIAGKGTNIDILIKKAEGFNVEFIGPISDEEKRAFMQKAWIFASPSLVEGFGITWIEANACGTPVVGYKIDGLDTVNDNTSIMVEKGNINALADAMIKIIEDNILFNNLSKCAVIHSKNFSWAKSREEFSKVVLGK